MPEKEAYLLVHGLNNTPIVFDEIASILPEAASVTRVQLKGHERNAAVIEVKPSDWYKDVETALNQLDGKKVVGIGFSLGGLLLTDAALKFPEKFSRLVLLAPAIHVRSYVSLLHKLRSFPRLPITSMTPSAIRAHRFINMSYYESMFEIQAEVHRRLDGLHAFPVPATVVISPKDEAVDYTKTEELAKRLQMRIVTLKIKKKSLLDYAHLVTGKQNLTEGDWARLCDAILGKEFS